MRKAPLILAASLMLAAASVPTAVFADTPANSAIVSTQSLSAVANGILSNLQLRKTTFTVLVPASEVKYASTYFGDALKADDYLRLTVSGYKMKSPPVKPGSKDAVSVTYTVTYRETADQFAYVKSQSKQILASILKDGMTAFEKERAIHDWVVGNVKYDFSLKNYSAYSALKDKKATCEGYTLLTYRLLTDAGITNRIMIGTTNKSISSKDVRTAHTWNLVKLDGLWYHLDTTWDDSPPSDNPEMVSRVYFNISDSQISKNHDWAKTQYPAADKDFRNILSGKITSDPKNADAYKKLLNDIGGTVIKDIASFKDKLQVEINAKKEVFAITYDFGSQDLETVMDSVLFDLNTDSISSLGYSAAFNEKGGVVTLLFNASYQ